MWTVPGIFSTTPSAPRARGTNSAKMPRTVSQPAGSSMPISFAPLSLHMRFDFMILCRYSIVKLFSLFTPAHTHSGAAMYSHAPALPETVIANESFTGRKNARTAAAAEICDSFPTRTYAAFTAPFPANQAHKSVLRQMPKDAVIIVGYTLNSQVRLQVISSPGASLMGRNTSQDST